MNQMTFVLHKFTNFSLPCEDTGLRSLLYKSKVFEPYVFPTGLRPSNYLVLSTLGRIASICEEDEVKDQL